LCEVGVGAAQRRLPTTTHDDRVAAFWAIYHLLVGASAADRRAVLTELQRWAGWQEAVDFPRPVSAGELVRLGSFAGHEIGAHGTDHLNLAALPFEAQQTDLRSCRIALEAAVGREVPIVAYPFGSLSEATVAAARAAGFRAAVTTSGELVRADGDRFQLPRLTVEPWDITRFARDIARRFA
jgi:peptidoglycan/xylan/chitin deacetylase (PgdA/CDA1 family)